MRPLFPILILALMLSSCSQELAKSEQIKTVVDSYTGNNLFNGSILIAHQDSLIYSASYGYANKETQTTISSSTLFPIASLTKQFTAAAILLLQEEGKLSIEDKIGKYVNVPSFMHEASIKNLLNHTAGIPDYWKNNIPNKEDSIYAYLFRCDSLRFSPNTNQEYSNSGYFLLGEIIEATSELSYQRYIKENIFIPLQMNNSFAYTGDSCARAIGYNLKGEIKESLATTADGSIISSVDDLLLWDRALSQNKLFPKAIKEKMFQAAVLENGTVTKNGFGWQCGLNNVSVFALLTGKYEGIVSHSGGLTSFAAYNQYDTQRTIHYPSFQSAKART